MILGEYVIIKLTLVIRELERCNSSSESSLSDVVIISICDLERRKIDDEFVVLRPPSGVRDRRPLSGVVSIGVLGRTDVIGDCLPNDVTERCESTVFVALSPTTALFGRQKLGFVLGVVCDSTHALVRLEASW